MVFCGVAGGDDVSGRGRGAGGTMDKVLRVIFFSVLYGYEVRIRFGKDDTGVVESIEATAFTKEPVE